MASRYKEAGVDVEAGDALVDWLVEKDTPAAGVTPHKDKIVSGIGGFAALFRAQFQNMKSPCLVSSTDGVGTKVKIASEFNRYETIGQDLVAMCVNDLICVGAEPLFFLDYYATGKLDLAHAKSFLQGVRKACNESGCALIGGETAEMPGVYQKNDFDCAGFAVGVVDEEKALGMSHVKKGDRLIGVESSGFHSNGYSLIRKLFADDIEKWVDQLLIPTHLYPKLVQTLLRDEQNIHAIAHVTGGGLDNLLRVIPDGLSLELKPWPIPELFLEVKKRGQMEWADLLVTLNCGIGLVLYVSAADFDSCLTQVKASGFRAYDLGEVVTGVEKKWTLDFNQLK